MRILIRKSRKTKIGLFPDVGATKRLTTLPGHVGLYLALTADSLSGVDCYRLGAATHLVSSENLQSVEDRLAELELNETSSQQTLDQVNQILDEYSADASLFHQSDFTKEKREAIDFAFGHNTIEEIIQALELVASGGKFAGQEKWAQRTLDSLSALYTLAFSMEVDLIIPDECVAQPAARLRCLLSERQPS